ncbi:hypothetical protein H5410_041891 [Solanum commersonii]|uniref:Uncharacterized protein n=1 Tax=Solanum commersonii TaxID=4109 RepID=A0A9J5XT67_SOLCO|nr:hypothetical protein H5410_041891 [Solanum commersonii]
MLTTWKKQYLSFSGRLTLIDSVLDNIPTYFMALDPIAAKSRSSLTEQEETFFGMETTSTTRSTWSTGLKRFNQDDAGLWNEINTAKLGE